jgi:acetyl esterase
MSRHPGSPARSAGSRTLSLGLALAISLGWALTLLPQDEAGAVAPQATAASLVSIQSNVTYGTADGVDLLMDVYTPVRGTAPYPAVIALHASGFYSGDKTDPDIVRASKILAIAGFVTFTIDYRLAPEYPYPAAPHDAQQAVLFVRENAERFNIDPNRIGIAGASAGATIGAWVAYVGKGPLNTGSRVAAVVGWSGPMDLPALATELSSSDQRLSPTSPGHGYLSGPDIEQEAIEASPITYVDPTDPPMLLTVGAREQTPIQQPELMEHKLQRAGIPVELQVISRGDHALYGANFRPAIVAAIFFLGRELGNNPLRGLQISLGPFGRYHRLPRIVLWVVLLGLLVWVLFELARGGSAKPRAR